MSVIEYSEQQLQQAYFLPHHAVDRPDKLTTKLRVVFDASCKTTSRRSLNDVLMVEPVVQSDLFTILIQFRLHKYAFTSDCEKMYRQVFVHKDDRIFRNILWRNDQREEIKTYQLNTVSYGTSSAPYLATKCIEEIANQNSNRFPEACAVIKTSFYVDDLITSCEEANKAATLIKQINELLSKYGFPMRKWASNHPNLLSGLDSTHTITHFNDDTQSSKTLGLDWNSKEDVFRYPYKPRNSEPSATKRSILSTVSSIFDPLGLIGPVVVKSKIILQRLWLHNLSRDESIPCDLHTLWQSYKRELSQVGDFTIPRQVLCDSPRHIQIHVFSDASELSYGACVYLRSSNALEQHTVRLLCAKGRVAPLKVITIPKLELMAAHLAAKLGSQLSKTLGSNTQINEDHYWCDSSIVLAWLKKVPNQLKTFVAHRVADILSLTNNAIWHHVRSRDNPADILSRGASAIQLADSDMWWHGLSWLSEIPEQWPTSTVNLQLSDIPEIKSVTIAISTNTESHLISDLIHQYSSLTKLQRVLSYCTRFARICQQNPPNSLGPLTVAELQHSLQLLINHVQTESFPDEFQQLRKGYSVSPRSRLKRLSLFLDDQGLIRVGGRIRNSHVTYNKKFPYVLPTNHLFTQLVVRQYHLQHFHGGCECTLSAIKQRFWIISGKSAVKKLIHNCVTCKRFNAQPVKPLMGDLPESRVVPSRAFTVCGTDFAGPFSIRERKGRGKRTTKGYLCLFVCFSNKAVHLEAVSDLTTDSFLACLKRFLARRGLCREIHSDNGRNFVGASREIKQWFSFYSQSSHNDAVAEFLSQNLIQWKFIPARSSYFGGLWEAAVKSAKRHLYRITGNSTFTFEEFNTLCCQIEAILNSRPLIPLSPNPDDLQFLTPAYFLVGDSLLALPEPSLVDLKQNQLSRLQMIQQMQQRFWKLWSQDYLTILQTRVKWHCKLDADIQQGALVLLREPQTHPLLWCKGRVIDTHPGPDGIMRVVTVKISTSVVKRPVAKVIEIFNDAAPN